MKRIFFLFLFLLVGCGDVSAPALTDDFVIECSDDEECSFLWRGYSEGNPCGGCDYANELFDSVTRKEATAEFGRVERDLFGGNMPLCERCYESDFDSLVCKCVGGRCAKIAKS